MLSSVEASRSAHKLTLLRATPAEDGSSIDQSAPVGGARGRCFSRQQCLLNPMQGSGRTELLRVSSRFVGVKSAYATVTETKVAWIFC